MELRLSFSPFVLKSQTPLLVAFHAPLLRTLTHPTHLYSPPSPCTSTPLLPVGFTAPFSLAAPFFGGLRPYLYSLSWWGYRPLFYNNLISLARVSSLSPKLLSYSIRVLSGSSPRVLPDSLIGVLSDSLITVPSLPNFPSTPSPLNVTLF